MHVSHLNASHDSPSAFYRSKAKGEELVKEAYPSATIVRPATMFGYEDRLLNNMASKCTLFVYPPPRHDGLTGSFHSDSLAYLVEAEPHADEGSPRSCTYFT